MSTSSVASDVVKQVIATGKDYNRLRKEGVFTDLEFRTKEGIPLKAHRVVVGANCTSLEKTIRTKRTLAVSGFPSM